MTSTPQQFRHDLLTFTPQLRAYARSLCRSSDKADDLLQDTLLRAWEKQDTLRDAGLLKPWSCAIMRNVFRSQQRYARFTVEDIDGKIANSVTVTGDQEAAMEMHDMNEALLAMPAEQREAIVLIFVSELSYEQAAALVGCAVGTMKSRVNRARRQLAGRLGILESDPRIEPVDNFPRENAVSAPLEQVDAHGFTCGHQSMSIATC